MQYITQPILGLLALSTLLGVCVHDMHIDKAMVHAISQAHAGDSGNSSDGGKVSVSSNAHTHSEKVSYSNHARAATARDPRQDKAKHHSQSDYYRLPGGSDIDHTLVLA
ncbi:hypothetical protein GII36_00260 [Candidatus Mycosynbacter amalyticus]|uniref:Uncharacterized protein n=1 Tax=Candidatus Mycosynbacter amalyticus TaxID=2665156 RepID=A0A857MIA2_9BACT|nr:hypothetical protein [Candidatus Mycosynbacter amalyticus]QHN42294.1 hypothetical protein GII36_00260 [Candidatus Mycosynbacter amalyticus]